MDPAERLACGQLLEHPYFDSLREDSEAAAAGREQERASKRRARLPRKHLPPGVSDTSQRWDQQGALTFQYSIQFKLAGKQEHSYRRTGKSLSSQMNAEPRSHDLC
ncbi:UNVERIFIED_CONTAM: hypothetical protein FKN15_015549 [Acipenser sinensis]